MLAIDHLVVAARTLDEGAAWVRERLGAEPVPGGRHDRMGTHNRLLGLGSGCYLEVIAIDPEAPPPGRPRWFSLDEPAMRERLAAGPVLAHWVARTTDLEAAVASLPYDPGEILDLARGPYRWRITVPRDGKLLEGGVLPSLIQWQGLAHPAHALPASSCALVRLLVPDLPVLQGIGLDPAEPVWVHGAESGLAAHVDTPEGLRIVP